MTQEPLAFSYEDAERTTWQASIQMTPAERLAWLMEAIEMVQELQANLKKPVSASEQAKH